MAESRRDSMVEDADTIRLFLCGDVMTGRGIDQILPYPGNPMLCERFVKSALRYVDLAEAANGPIPRPTAFSYIWGDIRDEFARLRPAARIANLETSITDRGECWPKGINYRMSHENFGCLTALGLDCCVLANNHVLDWGDVGLADTLDALDCGGVKSAGAGADLAAASRPAVIETDGPVRFLVVGLGLSSSGIPAEWAASENRAGVNLVDLSERTVTAVASALARVRRPRDILIVSIHWGGNWGYEIPSSQEAFAHALIDMAGVDIVHGHSSHHPKAMEVYNGRLVLYGCGDFINDYEGIGGREEFRSDLVLGYFPRLSRSGRLAELVMAPFRIRRFRLTRAGREDASWLAATLTREGRRFRSRLRVTDDGLLTLDWPGASERHG